MFLKHLFKKYFQKFFTRKEKKLIFFMAFYVFHISGSQIFLKQSINKCPAFSKRKKKIALREPITMTYGSLAKEPTALVEICSNFFDSFILKNRRHHSSKQLIKWYKQVVQFYIRRNIQKYKNTRIVANALTFFVITKSDSILSKINHKIHLISLRIEQ